VVKLKRGDWMLVCPHLVYEGCSRKCYPYVEAQYDRAEDTVLQPGCEPSAFQIRVITYKLSHLQEEVDVQ
jgi:hypothetical protein